MNLNISNQLRKIDALRRFVKYCKKKLRKDIFNKTKGVVHIGANTGQERVFYRDHDLSVLWIEPIPEVFRKLQNNLKGFGKQVAYQYLVTNVDDVSYEFNVANNFGESSSIFKINKHKDIWPEVKYENTILLNSITLTSLFKRENIDYKKYDMLVMDAQGAELLILKGAEKILNQFKYIKTEVADFEAYSGCCQVKDIENYLSSLNFNEVERSMFATRKEGGSYYDITYKNMNWMKNNK